MNALGNTPISPCHEAEEGDLIRHEHNIDNSHEMNERVYPPASNSPCDLGAQDTGGNRSPVKEASQEGAPAENSRDINHIASSLTAGTTIKQRRIPTKFQHPNDDATDSQPTDISPRQVKRKARPFLHSPSSGEGVLTTDLSPGAVNVDGPNCYHGEVPTPQGLDVPPASIHHEGVAPEAQGVSQPTTPIVAELVESTDDIAAQVEERLAERVQQELERLEEQRESSEVKVRAVPVKENSGTESPGCIALRLRFFLGTGLLVILVSVGTAVAIMMPNNNSSAIVPEPTLPPTSSTESPDNTPTGGPDTSDIPTESPAPTTDVISTPEDPPTDLPTPLEPPNTPRFNYLLDKIGELVASDTDVLLEPTTPQYQAFSWLADVDNFYDMETFADVASQALIERYVLVLIYLAMKGETWVNDFQFMTSTATCSWWDTDENNYLIGVDCNSQQELTLLELRTNGLQGSIPTEIGLLTSLVRLRLQENSISGSIPDEVYHLSRLLSLRLTDADLTGTISAKVGQLTRLTYLGLFGNDLSGSIPTETSSLTNVVHLSLGSNEQLTSTIPQELGSMSSLAVVTLHECSLDGSIPTEIGLLSTLTALVVSDNRLAGELPTEIGLMTGLENLQLHSNRFTGTVPSEFGNLNALTVLSIADNLLTGNIDEIFCGQGVPSIEEFWADCGGSSPEMECSCCTICCTINNECEAVGGLYHL